MFKKFPHFGLALALILPPLPVIDNNMSFPQKQEFINVQSVGVNPSLQAQPRSLQAQRSNLSFQNTLNNMTVTTTIKHTDEHVIQDVQLDGSKERISFKFLFDAKQLVANDDIIFEQKIEGNSIITKEWIYTNKPNSKNGSTYAWQLITDDPLARMHLEKNANDTIDIYRIFDDQKINIAHIEPFIYFTTQGVKKVATTVISTNAGIEGTAILQLVITESPSAYPLKIDPTINYGQWLGDGSASASAVAGAAVEPATGEIYVVGSANGAILPAVTVKSHDYITGFVTEIQPGNPPVVNWTQFIGSVSGAMVNAVAVNGDEIYIAGKVTDPVGFNTAGSVVGSVTSGFTGLFVVEVADDVAPNLNWLTWFQGASNYYLTALAVNGDEIYAGGYTSLGGGVGAAYTLGTNTDFGGTEGFVYEIDDGGPPTIEWRAWVGGVSTDSVFALAVNGDEIYVTGTTNSTNSWETASFTVGTLSGTEGYLMEITDGSPPTFEWRMWIGGIGADSINALAINGDEIYAGGASNSSASWETVNFTVGTLTNSGNPGEGFVVEITDGGPPTLEWRMWLGGVGFDAVSTLAINGDEIYAGGYSNSSASWDTASATVGTLTHTGVNAEGFVVEITDGGPPTLEWRAWLGSSGSGEQIYGLAVKDDAIFAAFATGTTGSMETFTTVSGSRVINIEGPFAVITEIDDGAPPTYFWLQWLTGTGISSVSALAVNGEEIYAGGVINGGGLGTVTDVGTLNYYQEGFVVEILDNTLPTVNWRVLLGGNGSTDLTALAVNGDEIYAGGVTRSSDSWDTAASTFGTFGNTGSSAEGFVVEIADGALPTVAWRTWLGSIGINDPVQALAVNGDEIYVGGYSTSTDSWETVGSTLGTMTNSGVSEGYVVEIADGGLPSLNWRTWLGGVGADLVKALALNGDEIYVGGYSGDFASWDTVGSTAGTFTVTGFLMTEGFVVEMTDGGPPTLNWRIWFGSEGAYDDVAGLAVNGEEIYAAGLSYSSASWDTASITLGTWTDTVSTEGYVVEIIDDAPPSLNWRAWIGSEESGESITSLVINGDEIYITGSTMISSSWETFNSNFGTFSETNFGAEGFIVEILDGATPSYNWITWLGSIGDDYINALAINGNEIYAGGNIRYWISADGTYQGTKYSGVNSGFLVEILDSDVAAVINALFFDIGF